VIRGGCDPIPLDKGGPVLGVLPGSAYESARIHLQTGDVLLLFTDGVVEAQNPAGEEYICTAAGQDREFSSATNSERTH